jgi:aminoglycoside N3'-acetyltransferase
MIVQEFQSILNKHKSNRPLVAYSALWPFLRNICETPQKISELIIDSLVGNFSTVLMPTFTGGYVDGVCDLNVEKSTTGFISEFFRTNYPIVRTPSAFFSFAAVGQYQEDLLNLKPKDAWGDGSLYHWLEETDAIAITIGVHPTHISYIHRLEWVFNSQIPYRFLKTFSGSLVWKNKNIPIEETLFVRESNAIENDMTILKEYFVRDGMKIYEIEGIPVSIIDINQIKKTCIFLMNNDPLILLKRHKK